MYLKWRSDHVETNKALVRRWFKEVWNEGREATIDELFAESGLAYGLGDGEAEVRGPAQLKPFVRNLQAIMEGTTNPKAPPRDG